jgi:hypothetical protein
MMKIDLNKQVFDKNKFNQTVNTSFTQLVQQPNPAFFDLNLATIDDFFILYNKFFFEIPKNGVTNSHEFLVKESGDYINLESTNEEIQVLLDEISQLRIENLQIREEYANSINTVLSEFSPNTKNQ